MRRLPPILGIVVVLGCGDSSSSGGGGSQNAGGAGAAGAGGAPGSGGNAQAGAGGSGGSGGSSSVTSMTIGVDGGTITTPDGVILTIPAGALGGDATISITRNDDPQQVPVVSHVYEIEPRGTEFAVPVELTIPFDTALLQGANPFDLVIAWRDGGMFTGTGWSLVDGAASRVTTYITHFSEWAVLPSSPAGCTVDYECLKTCSGVDVPDLCCSQGLGTCTSAMVTSFPVYAACYAECIGTPKLTNFGSSDCMGDCCTQQGWTVTSQGSCYEADASQPEAQTILDCSRACFDFPDASTLCGGGQIHFDACTWQENNVPNMGDECDGPSSGGVNSQMLLTGLSSVDDQIWGNPNAIHVTGGSFDDASIDVDLTCATAVSASGSMSGAWDGSEYTGTWTFGVSNGSFTIAPGWL